MSREIFLIIGFSLCLASCSVWKEDDKNLGGYYQNDGPPSDDKASTNIADVIPRAEPLSRTGNKPYQALGKTYHPLKSAAGYKRQGVASWYGKQFHGRRTSSGETYDMYKMTAAHPVLPLPSYVNVRNLENGRSVVVRVNDRGPFKHDRLIDLSYVAAQKLGIVARGTGRVEVEVISTANTASVQPSAAAETQYSEVFVQAGAFSNIENAEKLKILLENNGFTPAFVKTAGESENVIYRVRIGPLVTVAQAQGTMQKLAAVISTQPQIIIE